ncbi:helix-turn-helix domain-containing protein [Thiocystis violacea]|uniref:helix-turn-helix domain-containing protein n=1 Tax=Thiocystis violacea TaxID=13725 RepID=UPI0019031C72|nr:helix-turn-helix transcriptional regulator [Thiocystis violacea]MBK1723831.1 hypothetical protein [Thiocystis violacea]
MLHTRLKSARQAKGLKQKEVSDALGIAQGFVSRLENGDKKPSVEMLARLAELYGVSESYLIGHQLADDQGEYSPAAERLLADPGTPAGLRELAADSALLATLEITSAEWLALRSIELPKPAAKSGYVQLLTTIRGISRA